MAGMEFRTYFYALSRLERGRFACACGTSVGHLQNIACGKRCGEALAIAIDRESGGVVRCESLRPDVDFQYLRSRPLQAA